MTIESTVVKVPCRQCGKLLTEIFALDDPIEIRHLPILGRKCFLRLRPRRFRCPDCEKKPTTTERLAWHTPKSPETQAYERYLLLQMVNTTLEDLRIKEDIGYKALEGVIDRWIARKVDWRTRKRLRLLGLDEIALRKGHQDFIVLVTGKTADGDVCIVAVLPDRKKATVRQFLEQIPVSIRRGIKTVCTDLYDGYINAVKEVMPHVTIVADRFHVAKLYRACADEVRKKELRRLKQELPETEYKKLKGAMWAFRKKPAKLTPEEKVVLEELFRHSPAARQAYEFREQLTAIFEEAQPKEQAQSRIKQWIADVRAAGLTCFDSFFTTLSNWMDEITNYFLNRENSGFVEGFNNKVKVLKRRCYGIFNLKHLFQRIYLDMEGYRLFA